MAEGPGEQSQSLFRPPMSDPEVDLELRRGTRPKVAGPQTTQTKKEEAKVASTEEHVLQLRGPDFYLPLGGQPRISERKSWRAPIVTEQGNPGIYVQIDEWLPLYKGNIYVVNEVTGRMYLSKGEHLIIGRTPIPVAESTHHPGEKPLPSVRKHKREGPDQTGDSTQGQGGTVGEARGDHEGREPEWALPRPSDPCRPPKAETGGEEVTSRDIRGQDGSPSEQRYPTPRQQLIEADKRRRRRLAALARDHIMKLREEQDRMAYDWSEEYATHASSAK